MKILSIDPGYERVGIAILEKNINTPVARGQKPEALIYSSCFKTDAALLLTERISLIGNEINRVIKKYSPDALAIETLFFTVNKKTAMGVAEARGVIMYECSQAHLKIFEYTPLQIKIAVTSYGKSTKDQVIMMTKKLITMDESITSDDEIDAIAIGLTCFAHEKSLTSAPNFTK
ncbi:crossover junction endodeoxyribonuclease RuvC [Candidatus Wolfebacteria bacterium]|nr:MAG: crossover junction endodeoxyribonuclease RuvC [Candidatus Wolfebacteria bacterium]